MTVWLTAWIISALSAVFTARYALKAKLRRPIAYFMAATAFYAPLAVAINSGNSVVYAFDFIVPLVICYCVLKVRKLPASVALVAACFFISAGFLPLVTSLGYASSRGDWLLAVINCFRLMGILAVYCYVARNVFSNVTNERLLCNLVGASAVVILLTSLLQGLDIADANVFRAISTAYDPAYIRYDDNPDERFIVLGFFKAEQGRIAMIALALGLALFASKSSSSKPKALLITGSALLLAILTGSKTTLVACGAMIAAGVLISRSPRFIGMAAVIVTVMSFAVQWVTTAGRGEVYLNSTLYNFIASGGSDVETLDHRFNRYSLVAKVLFSDPIHFLGVYRSPVEGFNVAFFHNEFLSVLALSGLIGLILYLGALVILGRRLFTVDAQFPIANYAARFIFIGNIFQGATVAHVQPGFLFVASTSLSFLIYGLGSARRSRAIILEQ